MFSGSYFPGAGDKIDKVSVESEVKAKLKSIF